MDVGDVLLLRYGKDAHVAEILGFEQGERLTDTDIWVIEANMDRCKVSVRKIALLDTHIVGVFSPQS